MAETLPPDVPTTEMMSYPEMTSYPERGESVTQPVYYMMVAYFVMGSFGVLGNVLVLVVIFRFTEMRKQLNNLFIIHQSVADTLASIAIIAKYAYEIVVDYDRGALGSDILCRLWSSGVFFWTFSIVSTYNLVGISIERYLKVVHPIIHRNHFTKRKAVAAIIVLWTWGVAYKAVTTIPTTALRDDYCYVWAIFPDDSWLVPMSLFNLCVMFFLPVAVMVYCYTCMIVVLRRRAKVSSTRAATGQGAAQTKAHSNDMSKAQKNLFKTFLIVTVCFIFCWSWIELWFLLFNLGYRTSWHTDPIGLESSVAMVFLNSCINPVIYLFKFKEFQKGAKKLFCRQKPSAVGVSFPLHSRNIKPPAIGSSNSTKTTRRTTYSL